MPQVHPRPRKDQRIHGSDPSQQHSSLQRLQEARSLPSSHIFFPRTGPLCSQSFCGHHSPNSTTYFMVNTIFPKRVQMVKLIMSSFLKPEDPDVLTSALNALLHPFHPTTKGIRWGLVAHTVAMFSFLTTGATINREIFSYTYIDNREFHGADGSLPGAIRYLSSDVLGRKTIRYLAIPTFPFNRWLADGLLVSFPSESVARVSHVAPPLLQLCRCFGIYSMNYRAIALPSLLYLTSIGTYTCLP